MKNNKCGNCGFDFPKIKLQKELYDCECRQSKADTTPPYVRTISNITSEEKRFIKIIDGVTPFLEAYCQGIRERKGTFTIETKTIYDENRQMNFEYKLKD